MDLERVKRLQQDFGDDIDEVQMALERRHGEFPAKPALVRAEQERRETLAEKGRLARMSPLKRYEDLLDKMREANGKRRVRILNEDLLAWALQECADLSIIGGWSVCCAHGTYVANSYGWRGWATLALIVRIPRGVAVSVDVSPIPGASPGRLWKDLQPWYKGPTPKQNKAQLERVDAWVKKQPCHRFSLKFIKTLEG